MVRSTATTVAEYLAELPPARAAVVGAVRDVVRDRLPAGYEEAMNWGMISYEIPLDRYPDTYNGQPLGVVALAAQARYYALYLNAVYMSADLIGPLRDAYAAAARKLDMGKSCLRFKGLGDIDLEAVGDIVAAVPPDELIRSYEASRASR
jgi:Domain of unknown function (DU1801)